MTKEPKVIIITLTSLVLFCGLVYCGFQGMARVIYSQRTCEWANVDNIELHTHIDIPKINTCECKYEKEENIKMVRFDIDKSNVDLVTYVQRNNFKKVKSTANLSLDKFLSIESNIDSFLLSTDLSYTTGSSNGDKWKALLDNKTGKLWITIKYKD